MTLVEMTKAVLAMVMTKGIVMAIVVLSVLHSHISDFEKALILAIVSASVTGLFTILGMMLAARIAQKTQQPMREDVAHIREKINEGQ